MRTPAGKSGTAALPAVFFLVALFLGAFRVDQAPDIHGDEIMYYQAGTNLARDGQLTWLEGSRVWVHPPLFFAAEALWVKVFPMHREIFAGIHDLRGLGVLLFAATTVALFAFVRDGFGILAGAAAAGIFVTDPFVLRICRRIMLETQTVLLVVLGIGLYYRFRDRLGGWRLILVGAVFGLALLTKEIAFFPLAGCLLFPLIQRDRRLLMRTGGVFATALAVWSAYPLYAAGTGHWDEFRRAKLLGAERLAGVVTTTSWQDPPIRLQRRPELEEKYRDLQNLPSVSLTDALRRNAYQYASSYALIVLSPLAAGIILRLRRDAASRLLACWLAATAAFLAAGALLGTSHVQFGYLAMPPACAAVGAAFAAVSPSRTALRTAGRAVVAGALLFGIVRWVVLFGTGEDNSYYRLAQWVDANLPEGTAINASQPVTVEPASRWLFPHHELTALRNPAALQAEGVRYAILSSKDVWGGYGKMNAEYVRWLRSEGKRVFHAYGNTYWDLDLYRLPENDRRTDTKGGAP